MTEAYLHYLFDARKLGQSFRTVDGHQLEVLEFGTLNKSSGPDFLEAQTVYDNKRWAGHIEFHLNSSDWDKHGHQHDAAYGNVIAHFVLNHDKEIYINDFKLPVVELKEQINPQDFFKYKKLIDSKYWIPCQTQLSQLSAETIQLQLDKALENRLDRKADLVLDILKSNNGDEQKTLLLLLAAALGGRYNSIPMQELLKGLDSQLLSRLNFDYFKIRDLLLSLSGLQETSKSAYYQKITQSRIMAKTEWKTFGMRPPSQPKVRIEQMAEILSKINNLSMKQLVNNWVDILETSKATPISATTKNVIIINSLVPYLITLANYRQQPQLKGEAIKLLSSFPSEQNGIIKKWNELGISSKSAIDSQALLEQKNNFCNGKKCLICGMGKSLLKE